MPGWTLTTEGYLLRKRSDLESFQRYDIFASESGLLHCLRRVSHKGPTKVQPDLFDHLALDLEQSRTGPAWFIRDCRVIHRFSRIGKNYRSLTEASRLSMLLLKNLIHTESFGPVYKLYRDALDSWERGSPANAVTFKVLFRYARIEGYPVKEEWLRQLPDGDRAAAVSILSSPLNELDGDPPEIAHLVSRLREWISSSTDILI